MSTSFNRSMQPMINQIKRRYCSLPKQSRLMQHPNEASLLAVLGFGASKKNEEPPQPRGEAERLRDERAPHADQVYQDRNKSISEMNVNEVKNQLAERQKEKGVDARDLQPTTRESGRDAKEQGRELVNKAVEKGQQLKDRVTNAGIDATDRTKEKATEAKDRLAKKSTETKDRLAEKATDAKDRLGEKSTETKDRLAEKATEAKDRIMEKGTEMKDRAKEKGEELRDKAYEKAAEYSEPGMLEQMKEKAYEKGTEVKEKMGELKDTVMEKMAGVKERIMGSDVHPTESTKPPGDSRELKTVAGEATSKLLQSHTPLNKMSTYLCGFNIYNGDFNRQSIDHAYCSTLNEDFHQCALFDNNKADAKFVGMKYIISERLFRNLPENEKKLWTSNSYEVRSGAVVAPGHPDTTENMMMKDFANTYSKAIHFWHSDRDYFPMGIPQFVSPATKDGELSPWLLEYRDRMLGINTVDKKNSRNNIQVNPPAPGADSRRFQLDLKEISSSPATTRENSQPSPSY